jgi:Zn-dependent M16 (insulinase) family peptidase
MTPDPNFLAEETKAFDNQLQLIAKQTSDEAKTQLILAAEALAAVQDMPQNIELLPTLQVQDIDPSVQAVEYAKSVTVQGVPVHYILQPTNGLTYFRLKVEASALPEHLRPLLPMYQRLLNKLGTKKRSHGDFDVLKDLYTSNGVSTTGSVSCSASSIDSHSEAMLFKVGFLDRNLHAAFDLLTELLTQVNFQDQSHLSVLIQQSVKRRTESLVNEGVSYASSLACSSLTSSANSYESLSILKHDVELAASMLNALSMNPIIQDVSSRLEELHRFILHKELFSVLVHTSDLALVAPQVEERLELLFSAMKITSDDFLQKVVRPEDELFKPFVYQAYFTLPMPVNFVVEAFMGTSYTNPDFAPLTILTELMHWNFLHKEIREKGGAYGSGASADPHKGTLTMHSYRDPNALKTFNAFEKAVAAAAQGNFE